MRATRKVAIAVALISLAIWGCDDVLQVQPRATPPKSFAITSASGCGESYSMVTNEQDSLMATYGIPALQDTVSVCNSWTGTDYNYSFSINGSSDFATGLRDSVQQVSYSGGQFAGYDVNGTVVDSAETMTTTTFDFVRADSSTRQASSDSPYYGVYSAPSDAVIAPATSAAGVARPSLDRVGGVSAAASGADSARYRRHGIARKGVRALVDALEELPPSSDGNRRFHSHHDGVDATFIVDPVTQLLVGQEERDAAGYVVRATHRWARTSDGGWVHTETAVESDEPAHGRTYHSQSTIKFLDVRIGGVLEAPIGGNTK